MRSLSTLAASIVVVAATEARAVAAEPSAFMHDAVSGTSITRVTVTSNELMDGASKPVDWSTLGRPKTPSLYSLRLRVPAEAGEAIQIPHCNGRERILIDGDVKDPGSKGPRVFRFEGAQAPHDVVIEVRVSTYEKRIACSEPPYAGMPIRSTDGLSLLRFPSPSKEKGGGEAVVFVPGGHDFERASGVLVGTHPWNGGPWTYAAYEELLSEAAKNDLVLLMPSGLGNSLYVADAEDEVMRALEVLEGKLAVDRQHVSIWGASMGGAGATTISFHHPDRFAFTGSYFGDSRYDLNTYVKNVLGGEEGARRVNALDMLENARHLPVLLVHGEDDRTSPMRQSTMLEAAMKKAGFTVDLKREAGMGHEGPLVVKYIRTVVNRSAASFAPRRPSRVSYRSFRASDTSAYGVHFTKKNPSGESFVDLEMKDNVVHVLSAEGVTEITLERDALGSTTGREETKLDTASSSSSPKITWRP